MLLTLYKLANRLYRYNVPFLPSLIYILSRLICNSSVPPSVRIGKNTKFAYGGIACVIHARSIIGANCIIGQCTTIGGRSKHYKVPVIGNNVYIGAGAKILGPIEIKDNVVIGAGAIVIADVPENCIVAGNPARIIRRNIKVEDYV